MFFASRSLTHSEPRSAEMPILFSWRLWESLSSRRCYIYTRWDNDQEIKLKTIFFHSKIIFRQLMIPASSWSKLASSTSSAPLQVHQGRGNPLNIVSLHCPTFLYYLLNLIPPALLITILFHVCPRSLVSFRVEEGGYWANNFWRYKSLSSRKCWSSSRGEVNLAVFSLGFLCFPASF